MNPPGKNVKPTESSKMARVHKSTIRNTEHSAGGHQRSKTPSSSKTKTFTCSTNEIPKRRNTTTCIPKNTAGRFHGSKTPSSLKTREDGTQRPKTPAVSKTRIIPPEKCQTDKDLEEKRLKEENGSLKEELQQWKTRTTYLEKENQKLQQRLSQVAGTMLTRNNPAVTDLSDPYRPQKLVEYFSLLYDNDWSDAYEEIELFKGKNTKEVTQNLLKILMKSYEISTKISKQFSKIPDEILKNFKNYDTLIKNDIIYQAWKIFKKEVAPVIINNLQDEIRLEMDLKNLPQTKIFAEKCVFFSWMLNLQDPPMFLDFDCRSTKFDENLFRYFTSSGKTIDYMVWPCLYRTEKGPLMSKGVVQGKL